MQLTDTDLIPSVQEVVTPFHRVSYYKKRVTTPWTYSSTDEETDLDPALLDIQPIDFQYIISILLTFN